MCSKKVEGSTLTWVNEALRYLKEFLLDCIVHVGLATTKALNTGELRSCKTGKEFMSPDTEPAEKEKCWGSTES